DGHRPLAGAEVLGAPADLDDLVVAGDRPEPLTLAGERVVELGWHERPLLADLRDLRHPLRERQRPERGFHEPRLDLRLHQHLAGVDLRSSYSVHVPSSVRSARPAAARGRTSTTR